MFDRFKKKAPAARQSGGQAVKPSSRRASRRRWFRVPELDVMGPRAKYALLLFTGVAVMVTVGYLVAALVIFPAPMMPSERTVPVLAGLTQAEARQELQHQGLSDTLEASEPHPGAREGTVIWQDPPAGTAVPRGTIVGVTLSAGPPTVLVPDVKGYDAELAQRLLQAAGLRVDGLDSIDTKEVLPGLAAGTSPAGGQRLPSGRSITLHLAR